LETLGLRTGGEKKDSSHIKEKLRATAIGQRGRETEKFG